MLQPGTDVRGYRVERVLGHGGMGLVYEATQLSLDRTVALKVVAPHLSADATFKERFRREGRLQASLDHPNIVPVYEAGESEHGLYLAMRLIRGENLKTILIRERLEVQRATRIMSQVAEALEAAHEIGLIHRDVKPQNILVGPRDHAYLADFGLTKPPNSRSLTQSGQFLGSLDYIAPEQIRSKPATARSDVYSFGAVVYETLTGVVPYPSDSEAALLYAHLSEEPKPVTEVNPALPVAVDAVVERAMAKAPEDRYASTVDLMTDLQLALKDDRRRKNVPPPPSERPTDPSPRSGATLVDVLEREPLKRQAPIEQRRILVPALVAVLAACASAAVGYVAGRPARPQPVLVRPTGASRDGLAVIYPASWSLVHPRTLDVRLPVRAPIALRGAGAQLELGRSRWDDLALPPSLAKLAKGSPAIVTLGGREFYRRSGPLIAIWNAVGPSGSVIAACEGTRTTIPACERTLATLHVAVQTYPLHPDRALATRITAALQTASGGVLRASGQFASAKTRAKQAAAAKVALSALRSAAKRLAVVRAPTPRTRALAARLHTALTRLATGYASLASAASRGDAGAYVAATKSIHTREKTVTADVAAFAALGYAVSRKL